MTGARIGILLVGHGSHLSADSATPVHALARYLESSDTEGSFEIRTAFWKEEPELRIALDLMESREVVVVPVFTSEGYFTGKVVPRELRLEGEVTLLGGRRIHYARPVGGHPAMAAIVKARAEEVVPADRDESALTTLVVVGHGTELHPESGDSTRAVARQLDGEGYRAVIPAFMDQEPKLETVLEGVSGRVVVVPFFISEGWHAGTTIPRDLAGFELLYTRAVGTHPGMAAVVREIVDGMVNLARDSGAAREGEGTAFYPTPMSGPLPIAEARDSFVREVTHPEFSSMTLFQVEIRRSQPGRGSYEVRHTSDWSGTGPGLRRLAATEGSTIALRSGEGAHRPLRSSPDLAGGWRLNSDDPLEVWEFLDRLYPGALFHRFQEVSGRLRVTPFEEIAARQTGIHSRVGELNTVEVQLLVSEVCAPGRCLRIPVWNPAGGKTEKGVLASPLPIPCPEPCSVFITAAAKQVAARKGGSG